MRRFENLSNDQLQNIFLDVVNELEFRRDLGPYESRFLKEDYAEAIKLKSQDVFLNASALVALLAGVLVIAKGVL